MMRKLLIPALFLGMSLGFTACGGGDADELNACNCAKNAIKVDTDAFDADMNAKCEKHSAELQGEELDKWNEEQAKCAMEALQEELGG